MAWRPNVSSWSKARKGCVLAAGLLVLAAGVSLHDSWKGKIRGDLTVRSLAASRVLYAGGDPYVADKAVVRNFRYFPLNAVVLGPLTLLPVPVAQGAWYALGVGLVLWCFGRHRRWLRSLNVPWWVWGGALAISGRFIFNSLNLGQWNTSVYCLAFIGLSLLGQQRRWAGATLLGLSAVLKYMPSFFLLYLLVKRRWRDAGAVALMIAVWFLVVPSLVLGPARHVQLLQSYRHNLSQNLHAMRSEKHATGFSLSASLYCLLTPATRENLDDRFERPINVAHLSPKTAARVADAAVLAALAGGLALSFWLGRRPDRDDPLRALVEVGLWFALLLLISPEARKAQFLSLFTPCFAVLAALAQGTLSAGRRRGAIALLALALALVVASSDMKFGARLRETLALYGSWTVVLLALVAAALLVLTQRPRGAAAGAPPEPGAPPSAPV